MQSCGGTGVTGALRRAVYRQRAAILALAMAGCAGSGQSPFTVNSGAPALALESIEGPPPAVFLRFVRDLSEEATAQQVAMVRQGAAAPYRLRGYLAAHADRGITAISWVWDIYDGAEQRAFRISGEERSGTTGKSWAAADDEVLRRIARASMQQVAAFIATVPAPQNPGPVAPGPADSASSLLVRIDDFRPEAAGIFRLFRSKPAPIEIGTAADGAPPAAPIPLPRYRPAPIGGSPALAYADPER